MNAKSLALPAVVLAALLTGAADEPPRLPSRPITTAFHIEKSENRNQVHYTVDVDAQCRPKGKRPVRGYWRELEEGPRVVYKMKDHQQRAYGLNAPTEIALGERGGDIRVTMRALPDRPLRISTFEQDGQCRARAFTPIKGQPAVLDTIYVEIGFLFSIDYLELRGFRVSDGAAVRERIED